MPKPKAECLTAQGKPPRSAQPVLDEPPGLHDGRDAFALSAEHAEIRKRIAVDHDQIRTGSRRNRAEPAGHTEHFGSNAGGAGDDLLRRQDAAPDAELFRLTAMHLAQKVRAVSHFDAGLAQDLERL